MFRNITFAATMLICATSEVAWAEPVNQVAFISPPAPIYPASALQRGLEGRCVVGITLKDYGDTVFVDNARCTSPVFCRSAVQAVMRAKYRLTDADGTGTPGIRENLAVPVNYRLNTYATGETTGELVGCVIPVN